MQRSLGERHYSHPRPLFFIVKNNFSLIGTFIIADIQ